MVEVDVRVTVDPFRMLYLGIDYKQAIEEFHNKRSIFSDDIFDEAIEAGEITEDDRKLILRESNGHFDRLTNYIKIDPTDIDFEGLKGELLCYRYHIKIFFRPMLQSMQKH